MATSDQFKITLQQDSLDAIAIKRSLRGVLASLTELKITTRIVHHTGSSNPSPANPEDCIQTRISIIDSSIENEVGSAFLRNDSYRELRDFHAEQVKKSYETLQQNLESLQTLSSLLVETFS